MPVKSIKVENWFISLTDDPFTAPELRFKVLRGQVHGHPTHADGTEVAVTLTSGVSIEGRIVRTRKETFELGTPEPAYLKWLYDTGIGYDEKQPIKVVDKLKHGSLTGKRPPGGGREPGKN